MLKDYLTVAQDALSTQKELYHVKEQRLALALDEYVRLNDAYKEKSSSRTSCKYDNLKKAKQMEKGSRKRSGECLPRATPVPLPTFFLPLCHLNSHTVEGNCCCSGCLPTHPPRGWWEPMVSLGLLKGLVLDSMNFCWEFTLPNTYEF